MLALPRSGACDCQTHKDTNHGTELVGDLYHTVGIGAKSAWESMQAVLAMRHVEKLLSRDMMERCRRGNGIHHDPYFHRARLALVTELQHGGQLRVSLRLIRHGSLGKDIAT